MPSVAEILMAQGAAARAARERSGQLWGNFAAQAGAIPGEIQAQQRAQTEQRMRQAELGQRLQLGQMELGQAQRAQQQQSALDTIWGSGVFKDDGSVDVNKAETIAKQANMGHLVPAIRDQAAKWDESTTKLQTARAAAQKAQLDLQETQQDHLGIDAARLDPTDTGTFHLFVAKKAKDGTIAPEEANAYLQLNAPEQVKAQIDRWTAQSPTLAKRKLEGLKEVPKEGTLVDLTQIDPTTGKPKVLATGAPAEKKYEQKSVLLDGKPAEVHFDPQTGKHYDASGADVSGRVKPIPPASVQIAMSPSGQSDIDTQARMLAEGDILPSQMSKRSASYNAIVAKANKISVAEHGKPLNLQKLQLDYNAANRFVGSLNGPQQIRFKALADSVVNTIDEVKNLADDLQQGGIQKWNAAKRGTIMQVYGNTPQSDTAARYVAAVNTLKEEYANLANAGYAPTEPAWQLANQQINGDYGVKDLTASLSESQRLIKYRLAGFQNVMPTYMGGAPINPMAPTGGAPAAGASAGGRMRVKGPNGETGTVPEGTPLPTGWTKQ